AEPAMYVDTMQLTGTTTAPTSTPTSTPVTTATVYDDALASGWSDWSWSSTNNFAATTAPYAGTNHISWTATAGYAGLYLHKTSGQNTTGYTSLTFALRATQAGQSVQVQLYDNTDTA